MCGETDRSTNIAVKRVVLSLCLSLSPCVYCYLGRERKKERKNERERKKNAKKKRRQQRLLCGITDKQQLAEELYHHPIFVIFCYYYYYCYHYRRRRRLQSFYGGVWRRVGGQSTSHRLELIYCLTFVLILPIRRFKPLICNQQCHRQSPMNHQIMSIRIHYVSSSEKYASQRESQLQ